MALKWLVRKCIRKEELRCTLLEQILTMLWLSLDKVGLLGVKVWICRGEVYGKRDLAPSFTATKTGRRNDNAGGNRDKNFKRKKLIVKR